MIPRFALHKLKDAIERQRTELKLSNRRYAVAQRFKEAEKKGKKQSKENELYVSISWEPENPSEPMLFLTDDAVEYLTTIDDRCWFYGQTYSYFDDNKAMKRNFHSIVQALVSNGTQNEALHAQILRNYETIRTDEDNSIELHFYNLSKEGKEAVTAGLSVFDPDAYFEDSISFNGIHAGSSFDKYEHAEENVVPVFYNVDFTYEVY